MNFSELVNHIAEELDTKPVNVKKVLDAYGTLLAEMSGDDEIPLPKSLGKFFVKERAARNARNPKTGETVKVAAKSVPALKLSKAFKEAIDG